MAKCAARSQGPFRLLAQEFRDGFSVRYKKPLQYVPPDCDGCGAPFNLEHALICRKGGLMAQGIMR